MARRKHSKIDALPQPIKDTVERMMQTDCTYGEIADYIKQQGYEISVTSVWRHASTLNATVQSLRMAQENFRVIMDEVGKYPQLDASEAIIRLLSHQVLEAIQQKQPDELAKMDPEKLLRESSALIRAAAYKSRIDIQNKDALEAGFEQIKAQFFEAMSKERPDLYTEVSKFLAEKGGAA